VSAAIEKVPEAAAGSPRCRFCAAPLSEVFVDLGMSPLCETFLPADALNRMEPFYPLLVWVCGRCFLVQLQEYVSPAEIFTEYAYFSSYSSSWLKHARDYTDMAAARFGLGAKSRVGMAYTDRVMGGDYNRVIDVDGRLVFANVYTGSFQYARSYDKTGAAVTNAPLDTGTVTMSTRWARTFRLSVPTNPVGGVNVTPAR